MLYVEKTVGAIGVGLNSVVEIDDALCDMEQAFHLFHFKHYVKK